MTKPADADELIARLDAFLARMAGIADRLTAKLDEREGEPRDKP